jgi:hypothetical protein
MRSDKISYARRMLIARGCNELPLRVRRRSYAEFSDWLDGELAKLVARWSLPVAGRRAKDDRRR